MITSRIKEDRNREGTIVNWLAEILRPGCLIISLVATLADVSPLRAQAFPTKPITIVVPFAPGAADVFIRAIAPALEAELGQPIVIENRPGANGAVASEAVKRAAPDGYTLLMAPSSVIATRYVIKDTKFDACKDFTAVSSIHESPMLLAVYPGLGIKSVSELIEHARRNPGKMSFGSAGIGSVMHLNAEVFKNESKADLVHVPYKGAAVYIPDLITGRLDMTFSTLGTLAPQVADKKLVALAVLGDKTLAALPGVPSINETLPNFRKVSAFSTIIAPKGLPDSIRTRLHQATEKVLARDDVRAIFSKNNGLTFSTKNADEVEKVICAESVLLDNLTKKIGIQPN
jgi:tripartite-type tricarboxylate transporter receptor subunit TctC